MPSYFTYGNPKASDGTGNPKDWVLNVTSGSRFATDGRVDQNRRLVFVTFRSVSGAFIARCPISIAALLEAGAMHAELAADALGLLENGLGRASKGHVRDILERHGFYYTADKDMLLYASVAHLTASETKVDNPAIVFRAAAATSVLSLNLPPNILSKLKCPRPTDIEREKIGDAQFEQMFADRYPGVTYYNLLRHLGGGLSKRDDRGLPDDCLLDAGIASIDKAQLDCLAAMDTLPKEVSKGVFQGYAVGLLKLGREIFLARGITGEGLVERRALMERRFLPPIVMADGELFHDVSRDVVWNDMGGRWGILDGEIDHNGDVVRLGVNDMIFEFGEACGV